MAGKRFDRPRGGKIEGKKREDQLHPIAPFGRGVVPKKKAYDRDLARIGEKDAVGEPPLRGGERPGVPSRMAGWIDKGDERDEQ